MTTMQAAGLTSPIFIVGCEGSGTTLLRLMLNAHPRIAIPPESNFIADAWKRFGRDAYEGERLEGILAFLESFLGYQAFQLEHERMLEVLRELSRPTLSEVLRAVYAEYARRQGKGRWGDKTPGYAEQIPALNALFPTCVVIHVIRDGRDAALSMVTRGFGPPTLYVAAKQWVGRVERARHDGQRFLGPSRYLEIAYEELVRDPRGVVARVCAFIGEEPQEAMLSFHREARRHIPPSLWERHSAASKPVNTKQVDRWKRELTRRELLTIQAVAGRVLTLHGYVVQRDRLGWAFAVGLRCRRLGDRLGGLPRKAAKWMEKRSTRRSRRSGAVTGEPEIGRLWLEGGIDPRSDA